MIFLPYEAITFKTDLRKQEVLKRLHSHIDTGPWKFSFKGNTSGKEYQGSIRNGKFEIFRRIKGRNSALPMILGTVIEQNNGTTIAIKMRLHLLSISVLIFFCGFIITGFCHNYRGEMDINFFGPIGMLSFLYLITIVPFNMEKRRSIKDFQRFLEAEILQ